MTFPAKKNTAYSFSMSLVSQSNTQSFQLHPTLASGDIKVKIDAGSYSNITTLPTSTSAQPDFDVALTSSEMNGDDIKVWFKDQSGGEWCEVVVSIQTTTTPIEDISSDLADVATDITAISDGSTTVNANMVEIDGSAAAAEKQKLLSNTTTLGAAVDDISNTTTSFLTTLTSSVDDIYGNSVGGSVLAFYDGDLLGEARRISGYDGTTKVITLSHSLTEIPVDQSFMIIGRIDVN